jgi:hypothetical protein
VSTRVPLVIETPSWLQDHHFEGRPVLPSVLALQALAGVVGRDVRCSREARFLRFLPTSPAREHIEASAELVEEPDGAVRAALLTQHTTPGGITRAKEHVSVVFGGARGDDRAPPPRPREEGLAVEAAALYRELVPFGPSFHNATDPVRLWLTLAEGLLVAPEGADGPLGSPFPLDATLHLACAWGQRFTGAVTFPTGYGRRVIARPTAPGGRYRGLVAPRPGDLSPPLLFDLWILDAASGELMERVERVRMEDLSRGRLRPPDWIRLR